MQADALQMQKIYVSQASLSENGGPASWAYSRRNNRYMGDLFSGASEFNCDYEYIFFFYKHDVYKHIQAEILHLFKHNAKHTPASDFGYILVYWYIGIYIYNNYK